MGIAERKERERQRRRNEIIDAAEKVFFSKGVQAATMDEVADMAELSKGTLYLYFRSKDELYLSIHLRGLTILCEMFAAVLEENRTGIELVRRIGETYMQFAQEHRDYFYALLFYEGQDIEPEHDDPVLLECETKGQLSLNLVAQAIQTGIKDGSVRADLDPQILAIQLWGTSTGLIQIHHTRGEHLSTVHKIDFDQVIAGYFDLIRQAIAA